MPSPTHAGTVVYRRNGTSIEYLLITSKTDPTTWVLPKGHIDPPESATETAVRETREEAAVAVRIVEDIGLTRFDQRGVEAVVIYFLSEFVEHVPPEEDRQRRWCSFEEASALIPFDNLKAVLHKAHEILDPHA